MRISLTAGYDNSLPAILIANNLLNIGHEIVNVMVVSPFSCSRVKKIINSQGLHGLKSSAKKLFLSKVKSLSDENAIEQLAMKNGVTDRSLKKWCLAKNINYIKLKTINDTSAIRALSETDTDILIYAGGGILKGPIIDAVKGFVLNMHSGPLPEIRGMNAIEWATLLKERQSATVHFIDRGIDTGKTIEEFPISTEKIESVRQLRAEAIVSGINGLTKILKSVKNKSEIEGRESQITKLYRQCYVMSPAIKYILEKKISELRKDNI